jgi:hypothetical protein
MTRRGACIVLVASILATGAPRPANAYIHIGFESAGQTRSITWNVSPVRWFATNRAVPGVTASQFQSEVAQAFSTWDSVPTASLTSQYVGFTSAPPVEGDGLSVLGFESAPDLDRVLGATSFIVDVLTANIVESDVFFNSIFEWSVASSGEPGRFDLRSVATHEVGHFVGLGHSAIGETELRPDGIRRVLGSGAVMFPIALGRGVVADRVLQPDDVAGLSDLYPDGDFRTDTGIITGRVRSSGAAVKGAHVIAFNPRTGTLVGNFSGADGTFRIAGLTPGPHVIRVEPLDDADIDSFFEPQGVNINFQVKFHEALPVAPVGGSNESFDVVVQPK